MRLKIFSVVKDESVGRFGNIALRRLISEMIKALTDIPKARSVKVGFRFFERGAHIFTTVREV